MATTYAKLMTLSLALGGMSGCGGIESGVLAKKLPTKPPAARPAVVLATDAQLEEDEVESGSYVVAFRGAPRHNNRLFRSFRDEVAYHGVALDEAYLADPRVTNIRYLTAVNLANGKDPIGNSELSQPRSLRLAWTEDDVDEIPAVLSQVDFASADVAAEVLREWETTGAIWFAEPNGLSTLSQSGGSTDFATSYKNAGIGWHQLIRLYGALEKISTAANPYNPVVAVLDSGVDYGHPDLKDRIFQRPNYAPNQTGCGDDQYGCDTTKAQRDQLGVGGALPFLTKAPGEPCPSDGKNEGVCLHGTHVAGLVAARLNAGQKTGGACPWCQILPVKIIAKGATGTGQASDAAIIAGLKYLTQFREEGRNRSYIRIANSSFGKYNRARAVALMVRILSNPPHEILMVGAAGNEDSIKRSYPAALDEALAVASVDAGANGAKSQFSNYGPWVDIAAPGSEGGGGLDSTIPGGIWKKDAGTSMAAPVVAAVAGLVLAAPGNEGFGQSQLRQRLLETANRSIYGTDQTANRAYYAPLRGDPAPTPLLGAGLVDATAAVLGTKSDAQTAEALNRVDASCGVVGGARTGWTHSVTWVLWLCPVGLAVMGRARRKQRPL